MTNIVKFMALGDLMLSGRGLTHLHTQRNNYPFCKLNSVLLDADIVFGNLETPLTDNFSFHYERGFPRFAAPISFTTRLAQAGFDIVSLANNHILDQGVEGLSNTIASLDANEIRYVGIIENRSAKQKPVIIERNGIKIGFLAYAASCIASPGKPGTAPADRRRILLEVGLLRRSVDVVVVSLHLGFEYAPMPGIRVFSLMQTLLSNGVDIVLGHHPHVPQGLITYGNGVAFCSLGNCVSDQIHPDVRTRCLTRALQEGNPFADKYYDYTKFGLLAEIIITKNKDSVNISHFVRQINIGEDFSPNLNKKECLLAEPTWAKAFGIEMLYQVAKLRKGGILRLVSILRRGYKL